MSAAAGIMAAMDPTADPCQDFYQYSCGQWIRQNPIPEGKSIWGTFDQLWQSNQVVMKTVLGNMCFVFFPSEIWSNIWPSRDDNLFKL